MINLKNKIIPERIYYIKDNCISKTPPIGEDLDYHSIAIWITCGFFLGDKTFFKDVKVLKPCEGFINGEIDKFNEYSSPLMHEEFV